MLLYFDKCEEIWGGSPATTTLPTGIETNGIQDNSNSSVACSSPASCGRPSTPSTSRPGTPSSTTDVELFDSNFQRNKGTLMELCLSQVVKLLTYIQ